MQQEKKNNLTVTIISWALVFICMAIIFWLSSKTADESAAQSSVIVKWIINHFGKNSVTDFIVRKFAHFSEYVGLCFLASNAIYQSSKRFIPLYSCALTSFYAISDEFHQIFVDGRSCEIRDWAIDTVGALVGALAFYIIYIIIKKVDKKKNNIDTQIN